MIWPIKWTIWILALSFAAFAVGNVMERIDAQDKQRREVASSKGFVDVAEMEKAASLGITDAEAWRVKMAAEAAVKKAADEALAKKQADLQRQWEADAPKRAAEAEAARKRELAEWEDRQPPVRRMALSGQSWTTGGFDTVGLMSFSVKNDNPYDIKDFVISCSFSGKSGTNLGDRSHIVYDTVKAMSTRAFAKINIGFIPSQSARAGCSLVSAVRK
jgi:hypothetical protein